MLRVCCNTIAGFCLAALAGPVLASVVWDEGTNGDLSNNYLLPTAISVVANGTSTVIGTTAGPVESVDRDYLTFVIPDGQGLSALNVVQAGTTTSPGGSFIGIRKGNQGTNPLPANASGFAVQVADLLGYDLYLRTDGNILPTMAVTNVTPQFQTYLAQGFKIPLTAGAYTVWVQETATIDAPYQYQFDFVLQSVPEPSTILLIGLTGLAGLAVHRRRSG